MPGPLNLASLLRVSTQAQAEEGYGLDQQQAACAQVFLRGGHRHAETLIDDGISGAVRDRPAIRRALELLRAGAIQGVVVPRIDRVGRVAAVTLDILHTIREAGGVVIYADMDLPKGPAGRFVEGVLYWRAKQMQRWSGKPGRPPAENSGWWTGWKNARR